MTIAKGRKTRETRTQAAHRGIAVGSCLCDAVRLEITVPAFWAWHDHGRATQRAQGCAYATYVGCWKSKLRIAKGAKSIATYEDPETRAVRSFCAKCGTPLLYERAGRGKMINVPRALFDTRTGREPLYHLNIVESAEWEYRGEPLKPLKAYPGVLVARKRRGPPWPRAEL
jgi:hypothetical protein